MEHPQYRDPLITEHPQYRDPLITEHPNTGTHLSWSIPNTGTHLSASLSGCVHKSKIPAPGTMFLERYSFVYETQKCQLNVRGVVSHNFGTLTPPHFALRLFVCVLFLTCSEIAHRSLSFQGSTILPEDLAGLQEQHQSETRWLLSHG